MELAEVFADDGNRARRRGGSGRPLARALPPPWLPRRRPQRPGRKCGRARYAGRPRRRATLDLGHDEHAGVHLAAPEVTGEAVQDAVRVLRDPVDAGAPLQRRRGSRGLRAWRWVDDVHRRRAEEHKEEAAICRESERWG
ncbi:unnamed protein product [Miscanthus lutarioriparius]|uniref:Uncharacterized protein n=1 Tax=Miscanthus lutarioriparius TaxID=422564 RepID=A0A811MIL9_9POAL|nr:unnamed protein product [Miscanthus lutarioriparius]